MGKAVLSRKEKASTYRCCRIEPTISPSVSYSIMKVWMKEYKARKITYNEIHELHGVDRDRSVRKRTLWGSADIVLF